MPHRGTPLSEEHYNAPLRRTRAALSCLTSLVSLWLRIPDGVFEEAPLTARHLRFRLLAATATRFSKAGACLAGVLLCAAVESPDLHASPRKIDDYHWDQVDRIVA